MESRTSESQDRPNLDDFEIPLRRLRQPATVNLFKMGVLGEAHAPGEHQAKEVMQAFAAAGLDGGLDVRTWKGWFGTSPRRARSDGVMALDRFVDVSRDPRRNQFPEASPTSHFFVALLEEGLITKLLAPTEAKLPAIALAQRSLEYTPASAIHLHFDAIEAAAMSDGNGEVTWEEVKALAAKRIMELLHKRWSPRHGTIYRELTPSLELRWRSADAVQREQILAAYERLKPNMFDEHRRAAPRPSWDAAGISSDTPAVLVHQLLLAVSTDSDFLIADRFEAWVLDLASAAYAMHAMAWSERYQTHGLRVTPELIFWRAFDLLFLSDEPEDVVHDGLAAALDLIGAAWTEDTLATLHRARRWYRRWLADLGLDVPTVAEAVRRCWRVQPIVYQR